MTGHDIFIREGFVLGGKKVWLQKERSKRESREKTGREGNFHHRKRSSSSQSILTGSN